MAALGDDEVQENTVPTKVDSDSEVSCITGHLHEGSPPSSPVLEDATLGEEDVPPQVLDPFAPEEAVPWYERDFMQRAEREMEIEGPLQGCELPSILKLLFDTRQDPDKNWGQFEGATLFLDPHQVEQLRPWLPGMRLLTPSEMQARRAAEAAKLSSTGLAIITLKLRLRPGTS